MRFCWWHFAQSLSRHFNFRTYEQYKNESEVHKEKFSTIISAHNSEWHFGETMGTSGCKRSTKSFYANYKWWRRQFPARILKFQLKDIFLISREENFFTSPEFFHSNNFISQFFFYSDGKFFVIMSGEKWDKRVLLSSKVDFVTSWHLLRYLRDVRMEVDLWRFMGGHWKYFITPV